MAGWLASGLVGLGDVRDAIASLLRLDAVDTILSVLGIVPILGDAVSGTKVAKWLKKVATTPARITAGVWISKHFADHPEVLRASSKALGWTGEIDLPENEVWELMRNGSDLKRMSEIAARTPGKFTLKTHRLSGEQMDKVTNGAEGILWRKTDNKHERYAVEAAEVYFRDVLGYDVLYTQRNTRFSTGGKGTAETKHGPDIVAVNKKGETVLLNDKGSSKPGTMQVRGGKLGNQPAPSWLKNRDPKGGGLKSSCVDQLRKSPDPKHQDAADRLEAALNGGPYEPVTVVAHNSTEWGPSMESHMEYLDEPGTISSKIIKIDYPNQVIGNP